MAEDAQLQAEAIGPVDPSALGAALARSVLERGRELTPGIVEFAVRMNVPRERIQAELAYVSIITMHFCIGVVFEGGATPRSCTASTGLCGAGLSGARRNAAGARGCGSISTS